MGDILDRHMWHGFATGDLRPAACELRFRYKAFHGIPTMGRPASAVRSSNRLAPPIGRHPTGWKGFGRPLRNRNQAMLLL